MIKIYIRPIPGSMNNEVFLIGESEHVHHGSILNYINFNESGEVIITAKEYKIGAVIDAKPTMILSEQELREFIETFSKLGKSRGLRSVDENYSGGKLEATEKHLEDMRRLVFAEPLITTKL